MKRETRLGAQNLVLVFMSTRYRSGRDILAGIYGAAHMHCWNIQLFEDIPTPACLRELLLILQPIGCLVVTQKPRPNLAPRLFGKIPVVYLGDRRPNRLRVVQNTCAVARLAADELISGGAKSLVYVGPPPGLRWNDQRLKAFKQEVHARDLPFGSFVLASSGQRNLRHTQPDDFLARFAHPVGIFIASDNHAASAYHEIGPSRTSGTPDYLFVSVDNDEMICESLTPTLSSIALDFEGAGVQMVQLLHESMFGTVAADVTRTYAPIGVVHRASSRKASFSPPIRTALEYIRVNATKGIGVADIAQAMKMVRRTAERRFFAATDKTLAEALREAKIEHACTLLRDSTIPIGAIASFCGFSSEAHLKTLFKRHTGLTMRNWRAQEKSRRGIGTHT